MISKSQHTVKSHNTRYRWSIQQSHNCYDKDSRPDWFWPLSRSRVFGLFKHHTVYRVAVQETKWYSRLHLLRETYCFDSLSRRHSQVHKPSIKTNANYKFTYAFMQRGLGQWPTEPLSHFFKFWTFGELISFCHVEFSV